MPDGAMPRFRGRGAEIIEGEDANGGRHARRTSTPRDPGAEIMNAGAFAIDHFRDGIPHGWLHAQTSAAAAYGDVSSDHRWFYFFSRH